MHPATTTHATLYMKWENYLTMSAVDQDNLDLMQGVYVTIALLLMVGVAH